MDSVTTIILAGFVFFLIMLGRWTQSERGPFSAILKPLVRDVGPHCHVIAYFIYGAAAGLVLLYVSIIAMPDRMAILLQWSSATIIFLAALGGALGFAQLRHRHQ
jgi:hypothetical protein